MDLVENLSQNIIFFSRYTIDETEYFINLLTQYFKMMDIDELTNELVGKIPNIKNVHPLSDVFGDFLSSQGESDFTSTLPAIGVEAQTEKIAKEFLGRGQKTITIDKEFIDYLCSIKLRDRVRCGEFISKSNLKKIKDTYELYQAQGIEYRGVANEYLVEQHMQISVWADHPRVMDTLFKAVRDVLLKSKTFMAKQKIINFDFDGERGIYNYDTGRILYGGEFSIEFVNFVQTIEMPVNVVIPINKVINYVNYNITRGIVDPNVNTSLQFYTVGEENE